MKKGPYTPERVLLRSLLVEKRLEAGLEQGQLAAVLQVPQSLISRMESGDRRIDIQELREYCQAIGISLEDFVKLFEARLHTVE